MPASRPPRVAPSAFTSRGHRLAYTEFGEGKRWVLLMPGLLIPALMQEHLAMALAASGSHVLTLDPLGHGRSDRPRDMKEYSIESFAGDAIALLDHLDIDEAVVGGTSLGANVTLEVAHLAPEPRARHDRRDAGARERAGRLGDRVRTAARRAAFRRATAPPGRPR